jgi:hypothetical protein
MVQGCDIARLTHRNLTETRCASSYFGGQLAATLVRGLFWRPSSSGGANTGPITANSPILEGLLMHISPGDPGCRYRLAMMRAGQRAAEGGAIGCSTARKPGD